MSELSAASLRAELEEAERSLRSTRSWTPGGGPVSGEQLHLWPLPGPPCTFGSRLSSAEKKARVLFTQEIVVPEEADADIVTAIATRQRQQDGARGGVKDKVCTLRAL
eukprot:Hpha_TRINITY_DN10191_c0_g1::TRINITY_DN10191_c0_g1_i1::g.131450::m.131450